MRRRAPRARQRLGASGPTGLRWGVRSDLLPLSRSAVDRDGVDREAPDLLERLWADPGTRVVLVRGGQLLVARGPAGPGLALLAPADAARAWLRAPGAQPGRVPGDLAYLGRDARGPYLALAVPEVVVGVGDPVADPAADGVEVPADDGRGWAPLRDVGAAFGDRDAGLAATAVAILAWHGRHPRCPRCGSLTESVHAGWARRCVSDGSVHHPRTDPAVIVAVTDGADRLLLAHAATWPDRRFSLVAGYVEPGECVEAAVRRELSEEVGLAVRDLRYAGSQPWPFPASLMLAFTGRSDGVPAPDAVEITSARFVARRELPRLLERDELVLPTRTSVARALIEQWFGGPLPGP